MVPALLVVMLQLLLVVMEALESSVQFQEPLLIMAAAAAVELTKAERPEAVVLVVAVQLPHQTAQQLEQLEQPTPEVAVEEVAATS